MERIIEPNKDIVAFHLSDYLDDVREIMLKSRFRSYPVLDGDDQVMGTISRFHLLRPRRKQVVLVDHNEAAQSVPGLNQVEILEIIDHHRLADIQTTQPIRVRNEPVGSTNTILTAMYQERGVVPSPKIAGLMAGAILSDTVMFKSPTCTKRDIAMAERLARIAGVAPRRDRQGALRRRQHRRQERRGALPRRLQAVPHRRAEHRRQPDNLRGRRPPARAPRRIPHAHGQLKEKQEFDMVILMITDVLQEGSHIFYVGNDDTIRQAFNKEPHDNYLFLKGVMSRKKQIIPMLTALWG